MSSKELPNIYFFNPTCEYAVANGRVSWQPNRLLQKMEEDMDTLPLFFSSSKDIVLLRKKLPSANYLESLSKAGIGIPDFILSDEITDRLKGKKLGSLLPWGWSPATHHLLAPLKKLCSASFLRSPVSQWEPGYRDLYSKKFAVDILKSILPVLPPEMTIYPTMAPEICTTRSEIETLLRRWGRLMLKAPWSSSGRGLQPVSKTPVVPKVWEKILGIISDQGYIIAEPLLDKQLDLALQFELREKKIKYAGVSRFMTDRKGQYQGNFLKDWTGNYNADAADWAKNIPDMLIIPLIKAIEKSPLPHCYEGYFGVDTLIFLDANGQLRINPCLEINVRQNMGLLSLRLEKIIVKGKKGVLKMYYNPVKSFYSFQNEMKEKYPLKYEDKRISSGFLPLTFSDELTAFGAYLLLN